METLVVKKDSYYDSVVLMLMSRELKSLPDIEDAVVGMATEMNVRLLKDSGYDANALEAARPTDLLIAIRAESTERVEAAVAAAEDLLAAGLGNRMSDSGSGARPPRTLSRAKELTPDANLAVISVPGAFAAREARSALESGMHVMLFSDNVTIEEEVSLKKRASELGLLLMGPDCGTAIINGVPLCFANAVRSGSIGLSAASGTGLQEVTCLIDRFGEGISQAIGTGGRDLKDERVGGLTMLAAIEALASDSQTKVIAVISKPPAPAVEESVIRALGATGKPAVAHFIGSAFRPDQGGVRFATSLEEAAVFAVEAVGGQADTLQSQDSSLSDAIATEDERFSSEQRFVRGLFTGGTLADEALVLLDGPLGGVYSNNQLNKDLLLDNPRVSKCHSVVDLGDDVFTSGAPHPMIDPAARAERLVHEARDPETAVVLMDFVLGYGSHPDPAGAMEPSIREAKGIAKRRGGHLAVVTSITGTLGDFQDFEKQKRTLESVGCVVAPSNVRASNAALEILTSGGLL